MLATLFWGCRNSEDEDDGDADFDRREAQSETVTAIQFAAYKLLERVSHPNDFLRWDYLFQVIPAIVSELLLKSMIFQLAV